VIFLSSFDIQGRSDKGPAKDIITMMREFQAENERRRPSPENNHTTLLDTNTDEIISSSISNGQSQVSLPSIPTKQQIDDQLKTTSNQIKLNSPERRLTIDRNKLNIKPNRLPYDTNKVRLL
jgi:hypothetical protein